MAKQPNTDSDLAWGVHSQRQSTSVMISYRRGSYSTCSWEMACISSYQTKNIITRHQQKVVSSLTTNNLLITDPTTCSAVFHLLYCQKLFLSWSVGACCQSSQTPTCQPMLQLWVSTSHKTLLMHQLLLGLASLAEEPWRCLDNKNQIEFSKTCRYE